MASIMDLAPAGLSSIIKLVAEASKKMNEMQTVSLSQMNKPANIISRVYMQDSVAQDDIALPLLGTLNQLYASYIMTALNMQNVVVGGRTVRELYGIIATESLQDTVTIIAEDFGQETLNSTIKEMNISMESQVMDQEKDSQRLITGRLLEIDLTLEGNGKVNTFKVYVYVQLIPIILSSNICKGFLNINFHPPMSVRWKQVQAKEISFWNDFMLSKDLLKKQEQLLKEDKSGVLAQILVNQHNKLFNWALRLFGMKPTSGNLANSMIIMDKPTFTEACKEVGANFADKSYRQGFMLKTMAIFVVIVDVMGGQVEMYFNGIDVKGTYTFQMLNKVGAKGKDSFNLAEIMQTFSQGMSPRF